MPLYTRAALLLLALPASALRAQKKTNSSGGYVVTLGDSYSSGTGIHKRLSDYHNGDTCCRDFKTTPGSQVANNEGMQHIMPACAGDEIPQIRDQFANLQSQYPAEAARGWEGSVMAFTIGGNDVRSNGGDSWIGLLLNCIGSFYTDCHEKEANQVANFDELEGQLADFYTTVAQGASKATIRIWGYPRLLQRTWHCIPVPGVNSGATQWMDDMVDELNSHIASGVSSVKSKHPEVDIEFVDVRQYITKGACSTSKNQVHSIVLNSETVLSPMTFHPSQRGYNGYYDSLANSLGRGMPPSQVDPGSPEPWFIDRVFQGWDEDSDGKLSMSDVLNMGGDDADPEVSRILRTVFKQADADEDDSLSFEEFESFLSLVDKATA